MNKINKNRFLVFIIMSLFLLGILNLSPVVVATTHYFENCESITVPINGYLNNLNGMTTWSNKETITQKWMSIRSDYGYYVGGRSLRQKSWTGSTTAYWNFSAPIINISFLACGNGTSNGDGTDKLSVYFCIADGSVAGSIVLYQASNTVGLLVKDPDHGTGGYGYFYWGMTGYPSGVWSELYRMHMRVEGTKMNISMPNYGGANNGYKRVELGEYATEIVSIKFQDNTGHTYPYGYYYDDFDINLGVAIEEIPEGGCGTDLSGYNVIGTFPSDPFFGDGCYGGTYGCYGNNVYTLEQKYNVPSDMSVKAVGLLCDRTQSDQLATAGCYYVKVNNGTNYANPCAVIDYDANYDLILFIFPTLVQVTGNYILLEFTSQCAIQGGPSGTRWIPAYHAIPPDGDGDGIGGSRYSTYAANGMYDGSSCPFDLVYFLYYHSIIIEEEESPFENCFISTDKEEYMTGESVNMYYEINQSAYPTTIALYESGGSQVTGGWPISFPYTIPAGENQGTVSYSFFSSGTYDIKLRRQDKNITGCSIDVIGNNEDFWLDTRPNPSVDFFKIHYRYFNELGNPGLLLVGTRPDMHDIGDALMSWEITSNSSGNQTWVYESTGVTKLYVILYAYSSGTYQPVYNHIHWVVPQLNVGNIDVGSLYYVLLSQNDYFNQWYRGYHSYYNFDVTVKLNNLTIRNVGQELSFDFFSKITEGRWYNATLVLKTTNGSKVLDYVQFQVVPFQAGISPGGDSWSFLGGYKYVFAVGVLLIFVLIPMFLASRLAIDIPVLAYIASGSIGVVFCVTAGLLAVYWVFFIVVVLVAVAVIMFVR